MTWKGVSELLERLQNSEPPADKTAALHESIARLEAMVAKLVAANASKADQIAALTTDLGTLNKELAQAKDQTSSIEQQASRLAAEILARQGALAPVPLNPKASLASRGFDRVVEATRNQTGG